MPHSGSDRLAVVKRLSYASLSPERVSLPLKPMWTNTQTHTGPLLSNDYSKTHIVQLSLGRFLRDDLGRGGRHLALLRT